MSRLNDFIVNITLKTAAQRVQTFGKILIFTNDVDHEYTTYGALTEVLVDFADTTEVYKTASKIFGQNPTPKDIAIAGKDTEVPAEIVTALDGLEKQDWFAVTCTDNSDATMTAIDLWVGGKDKMYMVTTQNKTVDSSDFSYNTFICYHDSVDAYLAEAAFTFMVVRPIGSQNLKAKTLPGIPEAKITDAELKVLRENRIVTYIKDDSVLQTTDGFTGGNEYLDTVLAKYWIKFTMEANLRDLQRRVDKIPYSNAGIAMLVEICENVLKTATANGVILINDDGTPEYSYKFIERENTSLTDRSNRVYNGLSWTCTIAGAIDKATIYGTMIL